MSKSRKSAILMAARSCVLALSVAASAAGMSRGVLADDVQAPAGVTDKRPVITDSSIALGAYDPHGDFSNDRNVKIEHLFLPWEDVDLSTLALADAYALQRGRSLMITIEPWSWSVEWRKSPDELLKGILAGRYDSNMASVCSAAADLKSPVIIRWAQEMDDTSGQFTWSNWSPENYVAAYQRMITECRKHLKTAKYMWSPKGNSDLRKYYPGDAYVDIVGLSVFGLQAYDKAHFGKERTFAESLEPGYRRAEGFGKPIMVSELGYEGDETYVCNWAKDVAKAHAQFPRLTAVVYFNDREVHPWPDNYGLPNWRIGDHRCSS